MGTAGTNDGFAEIAALRHNREMHASNGNIDNPAEYTCDREPMLKLENKHFRSANIIQHDTNIDMNEPQWKAAHSFPILYYCRELGASRALTNAGTLYQYLNTEEKMFNDDGLRKDEFKNAVKNLVWIGVGLNDTKWHYYKPSDTPSAIETQSAVQQLARIVDNDYRSLALKIDLYDELRDTRFLQPSGVEYAWASPVDFKSSIVMMNHEKKWNYEAIFISLEVFEKTLAESNQIRVGSSGTVETWLLNDPNVVVIGARHDADRLELETWIVSHLNYPLACVLDTFTMSMVGSRETTREVFVRTAGLVDIRNPAEKIIFVIPDATAPEIRLGGQSFEIVRTDREGKYQVPIPTHKFSNMLYKIVENMLGSPRSLREAFTSYSKSHFIDGINWIEINSISVALTVRWHQRIESYLVINLETKKFEKLSVGAPVEVLKEMELTADPAITKKSYEGYGGTVTVNGLDQRYVGHEAARSHPAVKMGAWSNMAEISMVSSYARYVTKNVESRLRIMDRMRSGGQDRLMRGQFLRIGYETWKRSAGITDEIAFPSRYASTMHCWDDLDVRGYCFEDDRSAWVASKFVCAEIRWSWLMNVPSKAPGTLTGIRTISSWWRSRWNTQWSIFKITCEDRPNNSDYILGERDHKWTFNRYYQYRDGEDDPELESVLMRLDLERMLDLNWGLSYRTHTDGKENHSLAWVVDSSYGGILASKIGWSLNGMAPPKKDKWGWGLLVRLKHGTDGEYKSLVIPASTMGVISNYNFSEGTITYRGLRDQGCLGSKITHDM